MSITSAMFTGVSGLLANAEGINVIGNNLANVNTIGFKSGRMLFSDMLSVNIGNSSQIGRGTQIQKVDNVFGQGSFESTESVTDIALQGNSFFALKTPAQSSPLTAQSQAVLTRAGAFRLDESKFLVNPDGYQVVDTAGNAIQFTDNAAAIASALNAFTPTATASWAAASAAAVPAMYSTPSTAASTAATNALTAAQTVLAAAQAAATAATSSGDATAITSAATAITNANAAVAAAQNAVTLATTATSNALTATSSAAALGTAAGNLSANPNDVNASVANVSNTTAANALTAAKNSLNSMQSALSSVSTALNTASTSITAVGTALAASGAAKNLVTPGSGAADIAAGTTATNAGTAAGTAGTAGATAATAVTTAIAAASASFSAANTASTIATTAFSTFYSASSAAFNKVTKIDADGLITYVGKYGDTFYYSATNAIGIPTATATAGQISAAQRIAVINPSNPGGLDKLGGTLFQITADAGVPTTVFSLSNNKINGSSEKIYSNSLEQSNVDMAGQFVKMILTQRAYSANSKTITTADEMTQEVLNLKR